MNAHIDVLSSPEQEGEAQVLPNVELSGRYGIADTVDIGLKLNFIGAELNSRVALVLSDGFDLAVVPSAGILMRDASIEGRAGIVTFGLPILAGLNLSENLTVVFGPRIHAHLPTIELDPTDPPASEFKNGLTLYPGGVLGVQLRFSEVFALHPEVNFLFPYVPEFSKFAKPIWQGGIAFQFRFRS